ncbi:hypothetical protein GIR22_11085 [Pseudomonas sp. CCM 7891]|uniref:Uncharacterized protein n=1 Tax=Pseudomonas karstica TaxID=1055468 RepID=A0A7X2RRA3_9PSED|nr:hypothetical protein [Pseudomonas karstica]MTD19667.1 hypothetical protein [Pseudomonas karstica]
MQLLKGQWTCVCQPHFYALPFHIPFTDKRLWLSQLLVNTFKPAPIAGFSLSAVCLPSQYGYRHRTQARSVKLIGKHTHAEAKNERHWPSENG